MSTDNKPVHDRKQPLCGASDEKRIENGHLRWSSWTQRRLMHIGAPIAGLFAMVMPLALYTTSGAGIVAMSPNTPSSGSGVSQSNDEATFDQLSSSPSAQPASSSSATNTHTTSLTVNGQPISVPENDTKTTKITDVYGTTSVYTESTSTQTKSSGGGENSSFVRIDINHNRSP